MNDKNINSELEKIRGVNLRSVLSSMRLHGEITMAKLAETTALSIPTVKKIILLGMENSMIEECLQTQATGGRKAQLFKINRGYSYAVYFYLDGEALYWTVKDFCGASCSEGSQSIDIADYFNVADKIIERKKQKYKNIKTISFSVPAIVCGGKIMKWYYNSALEGYDVCTYFQNKYGAKIFCENDMKLTAIASRKYIDNYNCTVTATVQFGHNGIGLGQAVNGRVLSGSSGFAGEIGFLKDAFKNVMSVRYCAKIINALIVFTNPQTIIFYASQRMNDIDRIMAEAVREIPPFAVPKTLFTNNYLEDVLYGMEILATQSDES